MAWKFRIPKDKFNQTPETCQGLGRVTLVTRVILLRRQAWWPCRREFIAVRHVEDVALFHLTRGVLFDHVLLSVLG